MSDPIVTDDFWSYLVDAAGETEAYWLSDWLKGQRESYEAATPCACGSRRTRTVIVWDRTRNYCLEGQTLCEACGAVLRVCDNRDRIRQRVSAGDVKAAHVASLMAELGI